MAPIPGNARVERRGLAGTVTCPAGTQAYDVDPVAEQHLRVAAPVQRAARRASSPAATAGSAPGGRAPGVDRAAPQVSERSRPRPRPTRGGAHGAAARRRRRCAGVDVRRGPAPRGREPAPDAVPDPPHAVATTTRARPRRGVTAGSSWLQHARASPARQGRRTGAARDLSGGRPTGDRLQWRSRRTSARSCSRMRRGAITAVRAMPVTVAISRATESGAPPSQPRERDVRTSWVFCATEDDQQDQQHRCGDDRDPGAAGARLAQRVLRRGRGCGGCFTCAGDRFPLLGHAGAVPALGSVQPVRRSGMAGGAPCRNSVAR